MTYIERITISDIKNEAFHFLLEKSFYRYFKDRYSFFLEEYIYITLPQNLL